MLRNLEEKTREWYALDFPGDLTPIWGPFRYNNRVSKSDKFNEERLPYSLRLLTLVTYNCLAYSILPGYLLVENSQKVVNFFWL